MKKIVLKTGLGYYTDKEGHIIAKFNLPIGEHSIKDKYDYTEVNTVEELNKIEVFKPPLSQEILTERKIETEMQRLLREQAIESLKAKGEL